MDAILFKLMLVVEQMGVWYQGYYLRALKMMNVPKEMAEEHYVDLASKPFYAGLVNYIVR